MRKIVSCVVVMVLLASAVPLAVTSVAAYEYEIFGDINPHDDRLTKEELVNAILPYMLDEGDFTLDDVGDAAYVYARWNGEPRTVTDMAGREVTFYKPVERVISAFTMHTRAVVAVGGCDKLVGVSHSCIWPEGEHMCGEKIFEIPDVGGFGKNIELIASLRPDVVFHIRNHDIVQEQVNAPVVSAGARGVSEEEDICRNIEFVGMVLDKEEVAEELSSFFREKFAMVRDVIPEGDSEKPKACLVSGKGRVSTATSSSCSALLAEAGAITPETDPDIGAKEISVEQLIVWSPDIIFVQNNGGRTGKKRPLSLTREQVLEDPRLQSINAVKNGTVYYVTNGCCNWRPYQRILPAMMYMAKVFYPDKFEVDLEKEGNEVFKAFFRDDGLYTELIDDVGYLREFVDNPPEEKEW